MRCTKSAAVRSAVAALLGLVMTPALTGVVRAWDDSGHLARQIVCISGGDDVTIEIYLPHPVVYRGKPMGTKKKPTTGYFALDLDKLGKGKSIEPVRVWQEENGNVLVVDRFSRGLPLARFPVAGGIVDFDKRFAEAARCKPYAYTREDESAVDFPAPARLPGEGEDGKPKSE